MWTYWRIASRKPRASIPLWPVPGLIALLAGALYAREANPSVGGGNSGEFQVMAHVLGIAHPPSYPLYLLLAKGASLVPLPGDIAWRINLLTALLAAAAVFLAGLLPLAISLPEDRWPVPRAARALAAAIVAVAVASMPRLWALAVEAEVFTLHLALVIAFWLALLQWQRANDTTGQEGAADRNSGDRWLFAAALLAGLGLANHRTFLFAAAAGLLLVALVRPRTLVRGRVLLACAALVGLGLSPYLYVLRGLAVPVPYFSPADVHRLSRGEVWYVLQGNAAGETGGGDVVRQLLADRGLLQTRARWLWQHLVGQYGAAGHALAVTGLAGLAIVVARRPAWAGTALLGSVGAAVFAMAYGKYPDPDRYLLPLETLIALGIAAAAVGVALALDLAMRPVRRSARVVGASLGLLMGGYWALSLGVLAGGTDFTRGGYVHHTLHNLAGVDRGAVVCTWWASAWGWWYAQYVDGHRPDVTVVPRGPDECVRTTVPAEFAKRRVYLPALTDEVRRSAYVFFPSRDLWLAVAARAPLVEGSVLKGPDDRIYVYSLGQRRWVPSLDTFAALNLSWDRVQLTPDYVLREIPEGPPLGVG